MNKMIYALIASLSFAMTAHAADVVYVGDTDKAASTQLEEIYLAHTGSMDLEIAQVRSAVWNPISNSYEQQFVWNGKHEGVIATETLLQVVQNGLCDSDTGRGCLVVENNVVHGFYTKQASPGVKSVYAYNFNATNAKLAMPSVPTIYTWQKAASRHYGLGVCTMTAKLDVSPTFPVRLISPLTAKGTGHLNCVYLTGATISQDIQLSAKGMSFGPGIGMGYSAYVVATAFPINCKATDLMGKYGTVDAGVHVLLGARAGLGLNLSSLLNPALVIPAYVEFTKGLDAEASVNISEMTIAPAGE